jgi:hypothetical protein
MHKQMHQCAVESLPTEGRALADHCFFWPPIDLQQHSIPCACRGLVDGATPLSLFLFLAQLSDRANAGHIWAVCSPSQMVSYTMNLSVLAAVRFHRAPQNDETDEDMYGWLKCGAIFRPEQGPSPHAL